MRDHLPAKFCTTKSCSRHIIAEKRVYHAVHLVNIFPDQEIAGKARFISHRGSGQRVEIETPTVCSKECNSDYASLTKAQIDFLLTERVKEVLRDSGLPCSMLSTNQHGWHRRAREPHKRHYPVNLPRSARDQLLGQPTFQDACVWVRSPHCGTSDCILRAVCREETGAHLPIHRILTAEIASSRTLLTCCCCC